MDSSQKLILNVRIEARVKYRVFDLSGSLPFEIVYSLVRSWPEDPPDPLPDRYVDQPLTIRVSESLLDVNFALKHGFLKILDESNESQQLDFSDIDLQPCEPDFITLESGAGTDVSWKHRFIELSGKIDALGPVGKKFKPHCRYRLVLPNDADEFPVKWFVLGESANDNTVDKSQKGPSETIDLMKTGHTGRIEFLTLPSLRKPPQVVVKLSTDSAVVNGKALNLRAEIINQSGRSIVVKSRGDQNYLDHTLRFGQPSADNRPRITCAAADMRGTSVRANIHWSNLSIRNLATGKEMVGIFRQVCSVPVRYNTNGPRKILGTDFTTLEPDVPLVKEDTLENILPPRTQLEPGRYRLSLVPLGAVWFWGSVRDVFNNGKGIDAYPWNSSQTLPVEFSATNDILFEVV